MSIESGLGKARLILYHSQSTSARTLFLRHASGSVITPEPLPALSSLLVEDATTRDAECFVHPAVLVQACLRELDLPAGLLQASGDFHERVDTPGAILDVYLARFTSIDPPRALFTPMGGSFRAITEPRGGHPAEMALLQRAYQAIMG